MEISGHALPIGLQQSTGPTPGIHTIVVTARNAYGMVEGIHQISTSGQPISGLQAYSYAPTLVGEKTTFSATVETGTDVMYTWEFGDGDSAEGQLVMHTYIAVGTYTAIVTASNSENSEMMTISVEVISSKFRIFITQLMRIENPVLYGATQRTIKIIRYSRQGLGWRYGVGRKD